MEYLDKKKEELSQLKMIYNNISEITVIEEKIAQKEKELIDVEKEMVNIKEEMNLTFESSYKKIKQDFQKPKKKVIFTLRTIFLVVYIVLIVGIVIWSGINIVTYYKQTGEITFNIITNLMSYEIILIGLWVAGGFIIGWFRD